MLYLVKLLCVCIFSLPSGDADDNYQWEVQTPDGWVPYWEAPYALTAAEGGDLGHSVARVSSRVLVFAYRLLFHCKNSDVSKLNL
jgi:hypothetical protein